VTYLESLARAIQEAIPDDVLPKDDTSELFLLYAVVLLARGEATSREDVHNAWVAWMISKHKRHESMVPFAELPAATQAEDSPFVTAIRTVARRRSGEGADRSS
jgi:hypothetical protein